MTEPTTQAAPSGTVRADVVHCAYVCEQCGCRMAMLPPPEAIEEMQPRLLCPICLAGVQFDRHNAQLQPRAPLARRLEALVRLRQSTETKMRILRLNLKRKWWEQIKAGTKVEELRLDTDYWRKRLEGREYDELHLLLGYPKAGDESRVIRRKWRGYREATITHEEFGLLPVAVLAIDVSRAA